MGISSVKQGAQAHQGRKLGQSIPGGSEGTPPQTPHFMPTDTIELDIRDCASFCQTPTELVKRLLDESNAKLKCGT